MWKNKFKKMCFSVLLLAVYYLLGKVNLGTRFSPFGIALLVSMLYYNKSVLQNAICFLIASVLARFSLNAIYVALTAFGVVLITYFIVKKLKKSLNKYVVLVPFSLSLTAYIYLGFVYGNGLIILFSLILALLFLYSCLCFFGAFFRENNFNLNSDELICGGLILMVVSMGLKQVDLFFFQFSKFVCVFSILLSTLVVPNGTFLVSVLFGAGFSVSTLNLIHVAICVLYALLAVAFRSSKRIYGAIAVCLVEILVGLFFNAYSYFNWFNLLSVGNGAILFVLVPNKAVNCLKDIFGARKDNLAVRSVVNRTKMGLCKRMTELAQVFDEMNGVYRSMIKGEMAPEDEKEFLLHEVTSKVCQNCSEKNQCARNRNVQDVLEGLVESGLERGRVTLLDVPEYFTSKCGRINFLVNTVNENIKSFKHYNRVVENMDASRILIADQLIGVKEMLLKLSDEVRANITYDTEKENKIIEELSYKGVVCYEALVYESQMIQNVSLVIRSKDIMEETIEKTVSKICGVKMGIDSANQNQVSGAVVLMLKNKGNYDMVFGHCSVSKNNGFKCGDAHSVVKLDNGKYMIALCDGMGSGEKAQKISNLSIALIENYYKAGFENETILNSINKLLSLNNEEDFSSVDLCVLDFNKNTCDFIKLGATCGFVKNKDKVDLIESSGLPIGVLEEMKPHITKRIIAPFDNIILLSDGISDAFDNIENLQEFIDNIHSTNPQTISEEILDRAIDLNDGKIKDDMTVVVARVFPI